MEWVVEDNYSDEELVENKHSKLLKNTAKIYGKKIQRIKPPSRNEPSLEISEFHLLNKRIRGEELAKDLAISLDKTGKHAQLSQKVKKLQHLAKPLPAPLERPEAEKIKRTVAFDNAKSSLNHWEPIVVTNRVADQLNFPLNVPYFRMTSTKSFLSNMKAKTPLEQEVEKLLLNNPASKKENEEETIEKKTFFLNRKEIMEQRRELARVRAQQSYREAKAWRQNKIKSKKYHRILRRERTKKQLREFEELQKTDPEAALKKLKELEKTRAEERVTLRHRSTGQWARNKAIHAKYDKECRQVLAQQLCLSKDLTQKVRLPNGSDDEDMAEENGELPIQENNPWMQNTSNVYEEFSNSYRKFWDHQKLSEKKTRDKSVKSNRVDSSNDSEPKKSTFNVTDRVQPEVERAENTSRINYKVITKFGFLVEDVEEENKTEDPDPALERTLSNTSYSVNRNWKCTITELKNAMKNLKKRGNANTQKISVPKDLDDMFEEMEVILKSKFDKKVSVLNKDVENKNKSTKKTKAAKSQKSIENKGHITSLRESKVLKPPIINEEMIETTIDLNQEINRFDGTMERSTTTQAIGKHKKSVTVPASFKKMDHIEIDPKNFISIDENKLIRTKVPDISVADDDNEDEITRNNLMTISEAFTEDDVVAEFRQEKEAVVDQDKPKDIDLTLPGWGEWAGKGISAVTKRRKKRFVLAAPKSIPRKDDKKESVIINENADSKARAHQVNELPFPYNAVESFEASIRAPLGSTWIPETAHQKLTAPKVSTLMGVVIEPMTADVLIDPSEEKRSFGEAVDFIPEEF